MIDTSVIDRFIAEQMTKELDSRCAGLLAAINYNDKIVIYSTDIRKGIFGAYEQEIRCLFDVHFPKGLPTQVMGSSFSPCVKYGVSRIISFAQLSTLGDSDAFMRDLVGEIAFTAVNEALKKFSTDYDKEQRRLFEQEHDLNMRHAQSYAPLGAPMKQAIMEVLQQKKIKKKLGRSNAPWRIS